MSFLNPVSEPVLRFSSTDAGAPQINYNARVEGDVKAVLKACLVDGYGSTTSAGWSAINEVGSVIEFVSPSPVMSDYRLGVSDSTTSNTTWYYQYQNIRTNPANNAPTKSFTYVNKTHASNGWYLLATDRGIIFIEVLHHSVVNKLSTRITYWGQAKSGLNSEIGKNIIFFNIGHEGAIISPHLFYSSGTDVHINIGGHVTGFISAATSKALSFLHFNLGASTLDLVSPIYLASSQENLLIGQMPAMLSKITNAEEDAYGIGELDLDGRNVLSVPAGHNEYRANFANQRSRTFLIRTDYWDY